MRWYEVVPWVPMLDPLDAALGQGPRFVFREPTVPCFPQGSWRRRAVPPCGRTRAWHPSPRGARDGFSREVMRGVVLQSVL